MSISRFICLALPFFLCLCFGVPTVGADDWAVRALERSMTGSLGLPAPTHPVENRPTADKIRLGRKLFFDRRLSLNRTMSCGMCHIPEQGFGNHELQKAVGFEGRSLRRNAPTLVNAAFYENLFWDGRETGFETQFISPLLAANEMANPSAGQVVALIEDLSDYDGAFEQAFGQPVSLHRIGEVLAAYQRSLIAANSPFDRWRFGGDTNAISEQQQRGYQLFTGKAGCSQCHQIGESSALFTDNAYHDTGYGWMREHERQNPPSHHPVEVAPGVVFHVSRKQIDDVSGPSLPDLGRYEVTQNPADSWKYRTPILRNVALTAPYMHDGGFATLRDVLDFYNRGGAPHDQQSPLIRPLGLAVEELQDLEAFLQALTSADFAELAREARVAEPDNW